MEYKKLLLLIVFFAFFIRIFGAGQVLYTDEGHYSNIDAYFASKYFLTYGAKPMVESLSVPYFSSLGFYPAIAHHPPLSMSLFAFSNIFFDGSFAFRIIPIIFGALSIILIFLIAEILYDRKTAFVASLIASVSFYHILASVLVDQHGSIHFFLFSCAIYFFLRWEKNKSNKDFILSAVFAGLAMLNVYSAIFLFASIGFYFLIQSKDLVKSIFTMFKYSVVSFIVYLIFPLFALIFNRDILVRTFLVAGLFQQTVNFRYPVFILIWLGPLLLGLALFSLKNFSKKDSILWVWILCGAIPLVFTDTNTSIDRYFMFSIPAFVILSAKALVDLNFSRRQLIICASYFFVFFSLLAYLNLYDVDYQPHVLANYIDMASHLKWDFFFPITGPVGPAFGVVFSSILVSLLFSFSFLLLSFVYSLLNKPFKIFIVLFVASALAFNFLLVSEFLFSPFHPNYSKVNYELINYYKMNDFPQTIYTNNRALFYYLNKTGVEIYSYAESSDLQTKDLLEKGNLTVILFEFTKIPKDAQVWESLKGCSLMKTSYSKGVPFGYLYVC